jgi:hypothetical protein
VTKQELMRLGIEVVHWEGQAIRGHLACGETGLCSPSAHGAPAGLHPDGQRSLARAPCPSRHPACNGPERPCVAWAPPSLSSTLPRRPWPTRSASSLRLLSSPSGPVLLSMLGTGEDADPQHQPRARSFTTHCATPASVPASPTGLLNQKLPPTKLR